MSQSPKKVILVGHPNVGKSAIFSSLTGRLVTISNYPGTTVDIFRGCVEQNGQTYEIVDTPGVSSLLAHSDDERVTLELLKREQPDLIIQVADGKNIRRALLLSLELARLGRPLLLTLNMRDEREQRGVYIDSEALTRELGIPVVETVATRGEGIEQLRGLLGSTDLVEPNGHHAHTRVEEIIRQVHRTDKVLPEWPALRTSLFSWLTLLGALVHLENYLGSYLGWSTAVEGLETLLTAAGLSPLLVATASVTGGSLLPVLLPVLWAMRVDPVFRERLGNCSRELSTGIPILALTLSLLYQLVGNLGAQVLVELVETGIFGRWVTPFLKGLTPSGFFFDLLVGEYGLISVGITYGVAIVLPVVSTFFVAFSFLEDSGYLPRVSVLSDKIFRPMGLNGKAFLPMILGFGCVTMATMTTRILNSRKERLIATTLLALGVPCSAQLGVILGITAGISGWTLLLVFATVFSQLLLTGFALSRILPGQKSDFILEVPPIRFPILRNILGKTYLRVKWFLKEALPLFVLGSFVLFALDKLRLLDTLISWVEPVVVDLLELPRQTATVFFLGFLRRDYGTAGLFEMARHGQLDGVQVVVSLIVIILFVPCIANFFVMIKEHGLKIALAIVVFVVCYAIAVGTALNWLLTTLGVSF